MDKYQKKPVVVEAVQFTVDMPTFWQKQVAWWCGGRLRQEAKASDPTDIAYFLDIPTLEGTMTASAGDWIIKGVAGEFYPCKPDIFDATYEKVE